MNRNDIKHVINKIEPEKEIEQRLSEKIYKRQCNKFVLKPIFLVTVSLAILICFGIFGYNFLIKGPNISTKQGSYPSALMWNNSLYSGNAVPKEINVLEVGNMVGTVAKQVIPMPKHNGEFNDVSKFSTGNQLFLIKNVEITEAIAILRDGKYYRIDRSVTSLSIVWDNKIYNFEGNFDEDTINQGNIDTSIGVVKRIIVRKPYKNGDIVASGVEADKTIFPSGSKIYLLKNEGPDKAIAVEDKNGKFQKAVYIKKLTAS
ncbi:MAG: hypothetical protein WC677_04470 [Clostridia bacterium]|jgi:hypothetical protein